MVLVLKKEVIKTNEAVEQEDASKYRQLLVRTLHQLSVRFPDVAPNIIPVVSTKSLYSISAVLYTYVSAEVVTLLVFWEYLLLLFLNL